jgi:hypothetical protein
MAKLPGVGEGIASHMAHAGLETDPDSEARLLKHHDEHSAVHGIVKYLRGFFIALADRVPL